MTPEEEERLPPERRWNLSKSDRRELRRQRASATRARGFWFVALVHGLPLPTAIILIPALWQVFVTGHVMPEWYLPLSFGVTAIGAVLGGAGMWVALGHCARADVR